MAISARDRVGYRSGRLCIDSVYYKSKRAWATCTCDCGGEVHKRVDGIVSGRVTHCGCGTLPLPATKIESTNYGVFTVVSHSSYIDSSGRLRRVVKIRFDNTGYEYDVDAYSAAKGLVRDYLQPSVQGVGVLGKQAICDEISYPIWQGMLHRCYGDNVLNKRLYEGVTVCGDWLNYLSFHEWCMAHHQYGYRLDKDLKVLGSKMYSPETCTFVPHRVNSFVTVNLKEGVTFYKGAWLAQVSNLSENIQSTRYKEKSHAVQAYKEIKLSLLDELAVEYPDVVCGTIYDNICTIIEDL